MYLRAGVRVMTVFSGTTVEHVCNRSLVEIKNNKKIVARAFIINPLMFVAAHNITLSVIQRELYLNNRGNLQ